jgi:hypothetical protein
MTHRYLPAAAALLLAACATVPQPGATGAELIGQTMRVEIPGNATTILRFNAGGTVVGTSDAGEATGRWNVESGRLCMEWPRLGRECYPYTAPFRRGQTVSLTGTSGVTVSAMLQ